MNPSTVPLLVGGVVLVGSAVGVLAHSDDLNRQDTDYVFAVDTGNDSYCAGIVDEPPDATEPDHFRVDYTNLSETGRRYFDRALAEGRYVVEDAADTHFGFPIHYTGPGSGCYAVNYSGETYPLETHTRRHPARLAGVSYSWVFLGGCVLFVVGVVLAGFGLGIRRS